MTRIDEICKAAQNYSDSMDEFERYHTYPRSAFFDGAKWADKTMIDKVCQWFCKNITNYKSDMMGYIEYSQISDIIQDFRKAMEG